jgi:hypothetical protein
MISNTLYEWAKCLRTTRETLGKKLESNGVRLTPKQKIPALDIFNAITGDKEAAMTRKLMAEAEEKERDNRIAAGEIITVEEAAALYGKKVSALVQNLEALSASVPGLTFEQRQILNQHIEMCKTMAREAK